MEVTVNNLHQDLMKLRRDVELIKNMMMAEGELSTWAKEQLKKTRKEGEDSYVSLTEL